ncbi:hypothetical protein L917_07752 [Phytophthora nicotianae]|uniref:Uncharacterized protein n=1 Tax=Phytophthora nicotianae TaxID=4792 RepID=W2LBX6_PHYNI|nr:hypothetical protein L917_07752 [Phytophthora nicotianae]
MLPEHQVEAGPASQLYIAVTQARLPDEAPMAIPDNVMLPTDIDTTAPTNNIEDLEHDDETSQWMEH